MAVHAIVAEGPGQLSWLDVPDAAAGPGEVLIKVAAAGVNRADLLQEPAQPSALRSPG